MIRTCSFPIKEPIGQSWAEVNPILTNGWKLSTHAANWCIHELFKRDTVGEKKMPEAIQMGKVSEPDKFYGYGLAQKEEWFKDWENGKKSLCSVLKYAYDDYKKRRYDIMFSHKNYLLTFRYPYPLPLASQDIKVSYGEKGSGENAFPVISLCLPGQDGGRMRFRLGREPAYSRQMVMFDQLVRGTAKLGEAKIYKKGNNTMIAITGDFPQRIIPENEWTAIAYVHTNKDCLLMCEISNYEGRQPWNINADHLKRWQMEHKVYLQRMSEDKKRERRIDPKQKKNMEIAVELKCNKYHDRLDTGIKQVVAQVAEFCKRQKVWQLVYDDSDQSYISCGFPWHQLKTCLGHKLQEIGVSEVFRETNEGESIWLERLRLALKTVRKVQAEKNRSPKKSHPKVSTTRGK